METIKLIVINGALIVVIIVLLIRVIHLEKKMRKNIDFQRRFNQNLTKIVCNL